MNEKIYIRIPYGVMITLVVVLLACYGLHSIRADQVLIFMVSFAIGVLSGAARIPYWASPPIDIGQNAFGSDKFMAFLFILALIGMILMVWLL